MCYHINNKELADLQATYYYKNIVIFIMLPPFGVELPHPLQPNIQPR